MDTPLPPELGEVFTVAQARQAGVARRRLEGRDLIRPIKGVRVRHIPTDQADPTFWWRVRALATVLPGGTAFSHDTALRIAQLPLPRWRDNHPLHVTTPHTKNAVRRAGVVAHTRQAARFTQIAGLPVVTPLDAWLQCGVLLELEELVTVADVLCHDRPERLHQLWTAVDSARGQRGVRRLREAATLARTGSCSPRETRFRLLFHHAGLPEPELNATILHEITGAWLARPDFVWRTHRLVAEYDSDEHHLNPRQRALDVARDRLLREAGWTVVTLTNADHQRPDAALDLLAEHLGVVRRR